jgi:hypothetical protein
MIALYGVGIELGGETSGDFFRSVANYCAGNFPAYGFNSSAADIIGRVRITLQRSPAVWIPVG